MQSQTTRPAAPADPAPGWDDALIFGAVADECSFTRAALRLRLSQPTVSQRVGRLERRLGVRLLRRTTRRLELTGAGTVLLAAVHRIAAAWARVGERWTAGTGGRLPAAVIGWDDAQVLRTVYEECAFTQAAARLHTTQPTVSQRVARLERRLGATLFVRGGRRLQPTAAGRILAGGVAELVRQWDGCLGRLAAPAGAGPLPALRLAVVAAPLGDLPARLRQSFPHHEVEIRVQQPDEAVAMLARGEVDAAFTYDAPGCPVPVTAPLHAELLLDEPIWVAVGHGHRLAGRTGVEPAELAGESWAVTSAGWSRPFVTALAARHGLTARVEHVVDHPETLIALVADGRAITPTRAASEAAPGHVVVRLAPTMSRRSLLVTGPDLPAPVHRELRRILVEHLRGWVAHAPHLLRDVRAHPGRYGDVAHGLAGTAPGPAAAPPAPRTLRWHTQSVTLSRVVADLEARGGPRISHTLASLYDSLPLLASDATDVVQGYEVPIRPVTVDPPLRLAVVVDEPTYLLLPVGHRLAAAEVVRMADLAGETLADQPASSPEGQQTLAGCRAAGFEPDLRYQYPNFSATADALARGVCVTLASPAIAYRGPFVTRPVADAHRRRMLVVWHAGRVPDEVVAGVLDAVRDWYLALARANPTYWAEIRADPQRYASLLGGRS